MNLTVSCAKIAAPSCIPSPQQLAGCSFPLKLKACVRRWLVNWRTRRQLQRLPDFMLKDIGVSRSEAESESAKPFWRD